ncbi:uncharacterized protein CCOS01_12487 [Colletotrichum costaricense]|uniref:Uncharacterized protein n=2 Tax=Colletotrichum acutatum species complex TaxID=2707335 RepID=A0AAI9YN15_9PEZI|nr:uncharacterized protein CCOS01_12487 [Colletotrichum costaricense]XP_060377133.1 uncharacterized protein CTAM01_12225 [Colletotrichum tamarilloi]KAI3538998.1 hypothetical protein CSPX01_09125 [Colletotrichum filicis]KAK1486344.1 hypothetical protein CTAM01_12225 [Colletotrichum tamarilloi]KAK1516938.1 hypothetical protein CCOS01_12487 [Colletotrichum costaricense]
MKSFGIFRGGGQLSSSSQGSPGQSGRVPDGGRQGRRVIPTRPFSSGARPGDAHEQVVPLLRMGSPLGGGAPVSTCDTPITTPIAVEVLDLALSPARTPTGLTSPYAIDELFDLGENKQHELDEATQLALKGFTPSQRTFAVDIS